MPEIYASADCVVVPSMEIKESVGTDNQLYLAIAIKKSGVNVTASTEAASVTNPDFSVISIHELIEKSTLMQNIVQFL